VETIILALDRRSCC